MYSMLTFLYKVVEKIKVFKPYEYSAYLEDYNEKVLLKNSNTSVYFFHFSQCQIADTISDQHTYF